MTSEQGQRFPAEVGGTLSPAATAMYELVDARNFLAAVQLVAAIILLN